MLKHSFYKNKDVATKFGIIHFDSKSNSKDLTATQEAEFQGMLNYEVVHATTTTTTTTLTISKKTKEVEKQMEETATSTTKKPRKRNTAPKKQTK